MKPANIAAGFMTTTSTFTHGKRPMARCKASSSVTPRPARSVLCAGHPEAGYSHEGVDAPEDKPGRSMSALFVADGVFDADSVGTIFENAALEMPENCRAFVLDRIRAYGKL